MPHHYIVRVGADCPQGLVYKVAGVTPEQEDNNVSISIVHDTHSINENM